MRRIRRESTKVWHNPEIQTGSRRQPVGAGARPPVSTEDKRAAKQHRAALEALFAPRKEPEPGDDKARGRPARDGAAKTAGRIVLAPPPQSDPRAAERQKLLGKLLAAAGRPSISKAVNDFLRAGHTLPMEQDVYLQLLEHTDEARVLDAIEALSSILAGELPKRRAVLESRLRRIEQFADEPAIREAAARLRRQVSGRPEAPPSGVRAAPAKPEAEEPRATAAAEAPADAAPEGPAESQ